MTDTAVHNSGEKGSNGARTIIFTYGKNKIGSLSQKRSQFKSVQSKLTFRTKYEENL